MKKTKIIALFLMVFIVFILTLGCGGGGSKNADNAVSTNSDANGTTAAATSDEAVKSTNSIEDKPAYDELPVKDLNGYNFRIISRSQQANAHWYNIDIGAEAENGDPINDAVFQRNKTIEDKYNITIVNTPETDVFGKANKSIKAGSDDYDLIVIGLNGGQENLSTQGELMDLKNMPHVDLTKAWWDQKAVQQLSINNKLFASCNDLTIRDKDAIIILMFNKQLIQNNGLEDPYQLVTSGKWTLDKMETMAKAASKDLDGDGVINDADQIGLLTQQKHSQYLYNGTGEYISKVNAQDIPEITMYNDRAVGVCDKIKEIMGNKNISLNADDYSGKYADVWDGFQVPMFAEGRALFYHAGMNRVTLLRTMETDFGILPPPKFDENQTNYYASVDSWCTSAVSVPITVSDKDRTGLILEALTYESRYTLLPAYYDINLKTKFARDDESKAMIDIILTNRLYDLGDMYGWGSASSFFMDMSKGKDVSLTTYWDKNGSKIQAAMQKTVDKLNLLD